MACRISERLPRCDDCDPIVPLWCVTPELDRCIHRFFDTSPFSPSGRYIALTRLPYEDRLPVPGDAAEVVLVDLESGQHETVAETRGWDTQLGAQVQWGPSDQSLYYNDLDVKHWRPFGVRLDPFSGTRQPLDGTVYMVAPDGTHAASPCLRRMGLTQAGYGVNVPPEQVPHNRGAPADDGLYVTDTAGGRCRLLVSLAEIFETVVPSARRDDYAAGDFYGFHVKWNPQGTRLLFVMRWKPCDAETRLRNSVITMDADGTHIAAAVPDELWSRGGHHPNWCPDGERVLMNLNLDGDGLRFVTVQHDGTALQPLHASVRGSGHPTLHPDGHHILTDVYPYEPMTGAGGRKPIRWVDVRTGSDTYLASVSLDPPFTGPRNQLRVDPHPAWDRDYRRIALNIVGGASRRVCVADLAAVTCIR